MIIPGASTGIITDYGNPLRSVLNLRPNRIDEGVDYGGSGPIYALGPGTITNIAPSGWPGESFIIEHLTGGPLAGKYVYSAENISPKVSVGEQVNKNTVIGQLHDAYPYSEFGFTTGVPGQTLADVTGGYTEGQVTAAGVAFNKVLVALGAPSGTSDPNLAVGHVPSDYSIPPQQKAATYNGTIFSVPALPFAWANALLQTGHFPQTRANQQSLIAWALNESTAATYNPLASTLGKQYPGFGSANVRNYPNWNVGLSQTVATLNNGKYPNILAGLRSGQGIGSNAANDLYTWSGQGYTSIFSNWNAAGHYIIAPSAIPKTLPQNVGKLDQLARIASGNRQLPIPRKAHVATSHNPYVLVSSISRATAHKDIAPHHAPYRPTPKRGPGHPLLR